MATILVIDDDGIVRDALSVFLTRSGHEVVTAADGANGVLVFKNTMPDLVVLDRNLPMMSGSEVFGNIRRISKTTPVLVLSGYCAPEEVETYLRSGAAAFLSKGDGLSPALAEIDRMLGGQRKGRAPGLKAGKTAKLPAAKTASGRAAGLALIADDDLETRAILRRFLITLNYETIEAKDGAAALELARARRPGIVLLDIFMPKKDGVAVLKELAPEMPETDFIMITGNEDEALARECMEFGAFDYISKPINLEALGTTIKVRLLLQKQ